MHCYQPRLHIVESSDRHNLNWEDFHTIIFPGTQFTTVTAYQNDKVSRKHLQWGSLHLHTFLSLTLSPFNIDYSTQD